MNDSVPWYTEKRYRKGELCKYVNLANGCLNQLERYNSDLKRIIHPDTKLELFEEVILDIIQTYDELTENINSIVETLHERFSDHLDASDYMIIIEKVFNKIIFFKNTHLNLTISLQNELTRYENEPQYMSEHLRNLSLAIFKYDQQVLQFQKKVWEMGKYEVEMSILITQILFSSHSLSMWLKTRSNM